MINENTTAIMPYIDLEGGESVVNAWELPYERLNFETAEYIVVAEHGVNKYIIDLNK